MPDIKKVYIDQEYDALGNIIPESGTLDPNQYYVDGLLHITRADQTIEEALAEPPAPSMPAHARNRANSYPTIGDQLDMLWHAIDSDTALKSTYSTFHTAIKTIKDANPKS